MLSDVDIYPAMTYEGFIAWLFHDPTSGLTTQPPTPIHSCCRSNPHSSASRAKLHSLERICKS